MIASILIFLVISWIVIVVLGTIVDELSMLGDNTPPYQMPKEEDYRNWIDL